MKSLLFKLFFFAVFLFFAQAFAKNHRATVFVRRTDDDGATNNKVEVEVQLIFAGDPNPLRLDDASLNKLTSFPAPGAKIMDETFTVNNPDQVSLRVTENDGTGNSLDDGVCSSLYSDRLLYRLVLQSMSASVKALVDWA